MQGKDDDNNANEGTATSGEEIDKPNKDTERNYNVPMETRMSIGTPGRTNTRVTEAMGTRMNIFIRPRRHILA